MQGLVILEHDLHMQAAARLVSLDSDVVVTIPHNRESAKRYVPVCTTIQLPVLAHYKFHPKFLSDELGLSVPPIGTTLMRQHLLNSYDVGVQFLEDIDDPLRRESAIHSNAFVNVVGGYPENRHRCFR